MLTSRADWPCDPAFADLFSALAPDALLRVMREGLVTESAERRDTWRSCRVIEALYDPGDHVRIAYAMLPDASVQAERSWPSGDVIYVRYPVREPMSRRGEVLRLGSYDVEVYRFPNDRRLRGLRRFSQRERAAGVWQQWLTEDEPTLALDPASLRRRLLRYVPEQKWIVHLHGQVYDGESQKDIKRAVAVRSSDIDDCKLIYARTVAMRRIRHDVPGLFRVPKPVAIDTKLGLLAMRWVWGDSLLDLLRGEDCEPLMGHVASGLGAIHQAPMEGLATVRAADYLAGAVRCANDITAVVPALRDKVDAVVDQLRSCIPDESPDRFRTIHNDFHWKQLRGRADRLTILDLDRCCTGDPWVDVATFASQLPMLALRGDERVSREEAGRWMQAFLSAWESDSGEPIDVDRLRWYSAIAHLTLARGMMRHLRQGWPAVVEACVERASQVSVSRGDLGALA